MCSTIILLGFCSLSFIDINGYAIQLFKLWQSLDDFNSIVCQVLLEVIVDRIPHQQKISEILQHR